MSPVASRGKKVGLVLSGGGARGLAHIGVIDVLHKEGIPIDMIAGTSAGAIVGAIYARDRDITVIKKEAQEVNWKSLAHLIDPSLFNSGLIRGRKIMDWLASYVGGDIEFSDLKMPFACVATDIDTGEEVVMDSGSVPEALRASISLPGIFTVVKREGRYLVDGGLTTPVPVSMVRWMGADFVIAVNVTPDFIGRMVREDKEPNIFQVMLQSLSITTCAVARLSLEGADVVIEPDLAHIGTGDFQKAPELILRGEQAARSAIPEIKRKLQMPRPG